MPEESRERGMNSLIEDELLRNEETHNNNNNNNSNRHDDFLEQILSTFPNCSWPANPNPNAGLIPTHSPPEDHPAAVFHSSINNSLVMSSTPEKALMNDNLLLLQTGEDGSLQALYNGFGGSFNGQPTNLPPFQPPSATAAPVGRTGGSAPQRQRVRARRGQATDPHSIAERIRRERIAERMKGLQELVPNGNKTDKASMLDEIIDYVKFLQLQVKVLSMSRLGGAAAQAPLVADMASEGSGGPRSSNGNESNDNITMTEHQVAKLMEEDLGSAMQYLQRKGLCLMPISLATAISTATCQPRNLSVNQTRNDHNDINHSFPVESTTTMSGLTENTNNKASKQ